MPAILPTQTIVIDGVLADWTASERIDYNDQPGYVLRGVGQNADFDFALSAPVEIGPGTTFWFDTDRNAATGYQIFGFAGGAEFNLNIKADGTAALYTGGAGETLVLDNIPIAYSSDHTTIEFAIPKAALGDPAAMNVLYDVNNMVFGPPDYTKLPYAVYADPLVRTNPYHKIGIVFSQTTADHYFSETAYAQLVMAVQSQAMQAGISFDLLTEADLTDAAKLANYDALVFPSMANVKAADVAAITDTLLRVTRQFGVGLITAGNFLTNDETGAPLPGDSYARMKLLFDATRVTGGFPADVTLTAGPAANSVFTTLAPGDSIYSYTQVPWDAFQSVSGTGQIIATETVGGQDYAAALATQTGGKNVLFSTPGVMADNNLLWQAISYAAKPPGIQVSLDLSRFDGIVASRTDMDQSRFLYDVTPDEGGPGIYDRLLPIVTQWKHDYNFVSSYYVNIGNDPVMEEETNWAISAPYYAQLLALGNELGTHSYTHPVDTNVLTPAQIEFEFEQSKLVLEQQMSAYLGTPFTVTGAAIPGANETVETARQIIQYFDHLTGGFSGVGAGYPGAFGFLGPDLTDAVYLAPNTSFDFTLIDFKHMDPATAAATWAAEWDHLRANAHTPIVLWPWHDYGAAAWPTDPPTPSEYDTGLFTDWIARAYASGAEFVTEADLAARIESFYHSGVTSTVNGSVIDVTVTSPHAGNFALDLSGLGSQVIEGVAGWYAYDSDSLFLPDAGGSFSITTGGTPDDVTHITALPMRADLLSVTGDGLNLGFSLIGEGTVRIELGAFGGGVPIVTGGTVTSLVGDLLDITLDGIGLHTVTLDFQPVEAVASIALSADTGASASDFITNIAAQTLSGTLTAGLAAGDVVKVSLDNGASWQQATAAVGATAFTLAGVTLAGSSTMIARVENARGVAGAAVSQSYTLDQTPPPAPPSPVLAEGFDTGASADDGLTRIMIPAFTGTGGEAASTITLRDGTAVLGTGVVAADGSWGITVATPLADGKHSITATATDLAGNTGTASATLAITIDTTAPALSAPDMTAATDKGVSNADDITNDSTPTFTGTAEAGSIVTLNDAGQVVGSATASVAGTWTITTTVLADGVRQIAATAQDRAGNISASAALPVTIDTLAPVAPPAPMLAPGSDSGASATDNLTNITTPTFIGTTEAGATVTLYNGTSKVGTGIAGADGSWSITSSKLGAGVRSMTVKVTDIAGNTSLASAALAVTIDTSIAAPTRPDLVAASDSGISATDNLTSITTPVFTGTAEAGSTVTLLDGAAVIGTGLAGADRSWSITASPLADGVHAITATATDGAGNVGPASAARSVTIDTTAPALSAPDMTAATDKGASNADDITNDSTPTFTGTAEAGSIVTLSDAGQVVGSATANAAGTWTITATVLADGVHQITATAQDRAGNVSASAALPVTIDTLAPVAPPAPMLAPGSDSGASATDNLTNITTPTFIGTTEAGATVTLYNGTSKVGTGIAGADGSWSITSSKLGAGVRSMTVKVTDIAGNTSLASAALAVTIDTSIAAPTRPDLAAASDSGTSATDNLTNVTTPVFTGTAEAGSTVTLLDGGAVIGTGLAGADRSWSITASPLADGVHGIAATATDGAGNVGPASAALAVTIDTTAPAAPGFTGGTATSVTGTGEVGAKVALLDGSAVIGTATVGAAGTWNIGFIASLAPRSLTAVETDRAGNTGAPSPGQVLLGTAAANSFTASVADELFIGGAGADRYAFGPDIGHDIIADFAATGVAHDVIALNGIPGIASFADVLGHAGTVGAGVVIAFDADNSLTLNRVSLASLTASDFTFA